MRLKFVTCVLAAAAALSATTAFADVSVTPMITSDYDFRGISLSARGPAVQAELDLAAKNGLKGYIWASNTDVGVPGLDTEVDLMVGWAGGEAVTWDVGLVYYAYPGKSKFDYPEAYVGVSKNLTETFNLGAKVWYSNDYAATGDSGQYYEANATIGLPWGGLGLTLHAAHSAGKYWDNASGGGYSDFAVGLTKSVEKFNFALKVIDGSDLKDGGESVLSTDRKIVLSVATTFPWKD